MAKQHARNEQMETADDRISIAFKELSQRSTRPREIIADTLTELAHARESFTAEELWREVRKTSAAIGRATVFRSIEQLVEREVLERLDFADGSHRYTVCEGSRHHHHLACTQCHRVVEFEYCLPAATIAAIGEQNHFSIEGHALTIFGRCEKCRQ